MFLDRHRDKQTSYTHTHTHTHTNTHTHTYTQKKYFPEKQDITDLTGYEKRAPDAVKEAWAGN